jgi:hypothetical protein
VSISDQQPPLFFAANLLFSVVSFGKELIYVSAEEGIKVSEIW